jgi:putative oxidoreductase
MCSVRQLPLLQLRCSAYVSKPEVPAKKVHIILGAIKGPAIQIEGIVSIVNQGSYQMNSLQRYVLSFSRILMAIVFLLNGLGIISQATAAKELIEHGAPASLAPLFMLLARTIEVVAGFSLAFGIYPRLAAIAILAFLVPATLSAHAFWQVAGTPSFTDQLVNFLKNTAMMGGLLFIAATRSQPAMLPRTTRSNRRERTGVDGTSRSPARAF